MSIDLRPSRVRSRIRSLEASLERCEEFLALYDVLSPDQIRRAVTRRDEIADQLWVLTAECYLPEACER